jgi:hypothetical protein
MCLLSYTAGRSISLTRADGVGVPHGKAIARVVLAGEGDSALP